MAKIVGNPLFFVIIRGGDVVKTNEKCKPKCKPNLHISFYTANPIANPSVNPKPFLPLKCPPILPTETKKRLPSVQISVGNRSTIVQSAF